MRRSSLPRRSPHGCHAARQDETDRNGAIGRIDVQLVADPSLLMSLGVALAADIARAPKVLDHLRPGSSPAGAQTARGSFGGRCSPLRGGGGVGGPRLRFGWAGCGGFGVRFSPPSIDIESRERSPIS